MDLLLHTDKTAFQRLEDAWNGLLKESGTTSIFSRHEYLDQWISSFLGDRELFVVEMRDNARPVGFAPLMMHHNHFSMVGSFADYCGFVVAPDWEEPFVERLLDLFVEEEAVSVTFEHFQEESLLFQVLVAGCRKRGLACRPEPVARAPYVAIEGDWDGYTRGLSRNSYRDLRKKLNRLDNTPGLEVVQIDNQADFAIHFERMMAMHLRLWAGRRVFTPYRDKTRRQFLSGMGEKMLGKGMLRFTSLVLQRRPIAYLWCYDHKGVRHYLNAAWDAAHSKLSPGNLLLINDLRDAFHCGMAEYDLLGGGESYKYRYATAQRHITTLQLVEPARRQEAIRPFGRITEEADGNDGNLLVVTHADDEAIFFGALLRRNPQRAWTCCLVTDSVVSPALREQRRLEFQRSCELLGLEPHRLEIEEPLPGQTLDPLTVTARLTEQFAGRHFHAVYTHSIFGEYGHQHHAAVSLATHLAFEGVYSVAGPLAATEIVNERPADCFPDKARFFKEIYVSQGVLIDLVSPVEKLTQMTTARARRIYRLLFQQLPDGGWDPALDQGELAEAAEVLPQLHAAWLRRQPCPAELERAAAPESTIDVFTPLQCLALETAISLVEAGGLGSAKALARDLAHNPELVMPGARHLADQLAGLTGCDIQFLEQG